MKSLLSINVVCGVRNSAKVSFNDFSAMAVEISRSDCPDEFKLRESLFRLDQHNGGGLSMSFVSFDYIRTFIYNSTLLTSKLNFAPNYTEICMLFLITLSSF